MKRSIDIATALFGIWTAITGIQDADLHVFVSIVFTILFCIHAFLYRKSLLGYFKGLGWKWILVGVVLTAIVSTSFLWDGNGTELDVD
jgi:uncharacterized membrane protein YagU involved in acid resistance